MFGLASGRAARRVGPRGSAEAVEELIRQAVAPGVPAVLLANHGVLVFHRTPDLAILVGGVVGKTPRRPGITRWRWAGQSRSPTTCGPPPSSGR